MKIYLKLYTLGPFSIGSCCPRNRSQNLLFCVFFRFMAILVLSSDHSDFWTVDISQNCQIDFMKIHNYFHIVNLNCGQSLLSVAFLDFFFFICQKKVLHVNPPIIAKPVSLFYYIFCSHQRCHESLSVFILNNKDSSKI